MGRAMWTRGALSAAALLTVSAIAQEEPVGPCSPYRAGDGDIPSEMPGCSRRMRPAPGSLADEMQFRRARAGAEEDAMPNEEVSPPAGRRKRARPHRPR